MHHCSAVPDGRINGTCQVKTPRVEYALLEQPNKIDIKLKMLEIK